MRARSAEKSRTGSAKNVYMRNGELFAKAHESPSPSRRKKVTTIDQFPATSTYKTHYATPATKEMAKNAKVLMPYTSNAPRNRIPVVFESEPQKHIRFCAPRNETSGELKGLLTTNVSEKSRFLSTSKVHYVPHTDGMPVGFQNTGIVAEKTHWIHKRQQD